MPFVYKIKDEMQPDAVVTMLNLLLAKATELRLSAKQAHWNVKGENFIALHELFDRVSSAVDEYADTLAERAVQLGGTAQGTLQTVFSQSSSTYHVDIPTGQEHIKALSGAIGALADIHRQAIGTAIAAGDMVTADLCTEITRGLDKLHWLVRSHMA